MAKWIWPLVSLGTVALVLLALSSGVEGQRASSAPVRDAIAEAQAPPSGAPAPTQQDKSDRFDASKADPSSGALETQPDKGQATGFDFYRDPLNAKRPMQSFDETMKADVADKPTVMAAQRKLLESRYTLSPKLDPDAKMSRGKPLAVGPTARLASGLTWDDLARLSPDEIKRRGVFPYPPLPHPKHVTGGQVFPQIQTRMFPRLERFDVEFDIPEAFLPEFPPAIFLQNRPELGDVSRGEVVSINNYYRLFKDLLTPVQLDGLRMLLTPFPQEEFNPTDDRKSAQPSLGVTCLDCHVNGHTTAQFHLNPDDRPQQRRFRLDTVSLRSRWPTWPRCRTCSVSRRPQSWGQPVGSIPGRRHQTSSAVSRCSTARVNAPVATPGRGSSTTRCTTSRWSASPRSPATDPSRRSPCAGSRTARRICTTDAC